MFAPLALSLLACTALAMEARPLGLFARQSCDIGWKECGDGCIPTTYTCCPDKTGGCPISEVCWLGSNDVYGCCPILETCEGPGGVSTLPGGGGTVTSTSKSTQTSHSTITSTSTSKSTSAPFSSSPESSPTTTSTDSSTTTTTSKSNGSTTTTTASSKTSTSTSTVVTAAADAVGPVMALHGLAAMAAAALVL